MKFNWGTGIFLFYTLFAGMLVFQVIKSTHYDHSLVVEEYYAEDLAYQQKYDRIQNSLNLQEPLRIEYNQDLDMVILYFPFPGENLKGEALFYRPSSKDLDVQFALQVDADGKMLIPTKQLTGGRWKVEITWSFNEEDYYDEKAIDLIGDKTLAGSVPK